MEKQTQNVNTSQIAQLEKQLADEEKSFVSALETYQKEKAEYDAKQKAEHEQNVALAVAGNLGRSEGHNSVTAEDVHKSEYRRARNARIKAIRAYMTNNNPPVLPTEPKEIAALQAKIDTLKTAN